MSALSSKPDTEEELEVELMEDRTTPPRFSFQLARVLSLDDDVALRAGEAASCAMRNCSSSLLSFGRRRSIFLQLAAYDQLTVDIEDRKEEDDDLRTHERHYRVLAHRLRNRHRGDELEQLWRDFSSDLMLNWEEVLRLEEQQALLDERLGTLLDKYGFDGRALMRFHPP